METDNKLPEITVFSRLREEYNETHDEKLTQVKLAEILKISRDTLIRIEKGESFPKKEVLEKYSKFFKVPIAYLTEPDKKISINKAMLGQVFGLSEDALDTLKLMRSLSTKNENISAVVSAFLGNGLDTVILFQNLLSYLSSEEYLRNPKDFSWQEKWMYDTFTEYIKTFVVPRLHNTMKNHEKMQETKMELPDEDRF